MVIFPDRCIKAPRPVPVVSRSQVQRRAIGEKENEVEDKFAKGLFKRERERDGLMK